MKSSFASQIMDPITNREKEVLYLISLGYSTKEIAGDLFISRETVKTHRRNLFSKLDATNAAILVRRAFEYQLLPDDSSNFSKLKSFQ